jgi:hypothetical protein
MFPRRINRRSIMRISALILLLLGVGCYSYQPLETATPAAGTRVEAVLTDAGSVQMASQIGPGASAVRGEVVESDSETMLLALRSVLGRNEQETFWNGEQVRIPLATLARVQQRKFAPGKTLLFGGAFAGSLLAAVEAFISGGEGGGGGAGGGDPAPQ